MKSSLVVIIFGVANISILQMYAKSKLGPTPLYLPLSLAIISVIMAVITIKQIISKKRKNIISKIFCLVVWIYLFIFNIYQFNNILYVA